MMAKRVQADKDAEVFELNLQPCHVMIIMRVFAYTEDCSELLAEISDLFEAMAEVKHKIAVAVKAQIERELGEMMEHLSLDDWEAIWANTEEANREAGQ